MLVALLTVNFAPLHIDAHYSATTPHGRRIVNGLLIASIAIGLGNQDLHPVGKRPFSIDEIAHHAPTFHGDTITCATEIEAVEQVGDELRLGVCTTVTKSDGELVMTLRRTVHSTIESGSA